MEQGRGETLDGDRQGRPAALAAAVPADIPGSGYPVSPAGRQELVANPGWLFSRNSVRTLLVVRPWKSK